jgi:hypothetical protein
MGPATAVTEPGVKGPASPRPADRANVTRIQGCAHLAASVSLPDEVWQDPRVRLPVWGLKAPATF